MFLDTCVVSIKKGDFVVFGLNSYAPSFASASSFAPVPKTPKSQGEILKEKTHEEAQKARQKNKEERTAGDYLTIGLDTVNQIKDNVPVVYADEVSKLNYLI